MSDARDQLDGGGPVTRWAESDRTMLLTDRGMRLLSDAERSGLDLYGGGHVFHAAGMTHPIMIPGWPTKLPGPDWLAGFLPCPVCTGEPML